MKKIKKRVLSIMLILTFVMTSTITVFAGVERRFWDMNIRSFGRESVLTTRNKETNNEYSWVKLTSMTSVGTVTCGFKGPTYYLGGAKKISNNVNTNQWTQCWYSVNSGGKHAPIALYARNHYKNSSTGYISGWVDYE
jgi:hypothetical protein